MSNTDEGPNAKVERGLVENIRVVKAMQTTTLEQIYAFDGIANRAVAPMQSSAHRDLAEEISDAVKTGQDHVAALQHIIDKLQTLVARK